jgi:hypothetical protein
MISSLFETLQTMWWGIYGLVETDAFEIYPKHHFTMFVGLTMFGVYSCIVIIVLVNMLIAMMSNSYQTIAVSFPFYSKILKKIERIGRP